MGGKEREGQLILGSVKGEVEVVVGGMKGRVSGGNKDIRSQEIEDLLSFMVWAVARVLPLLGLFPCLGLFSELCREPVWNGEISVGSIG